MRKETALLDWRRNTFGSLSAALRLRDSYAPPPLLPDTSGPLRLARYESSMLPKPVLPSAEQHLPNQEKPSSVPAPARPNPGAPTTGSD